MITKEQADETINQKILKFIASYKTTRLNIGFIVSYDFGWYYSFTVTGEKLAGGPDYGVFIDNMYGIEYPLHYVGIHWDTGLGRQFPALTNVKGKFYPSLTSLRFFLKHLQIQRLIKEDKIKLDKSFKTESGYDFDAAIKWLKCDMCFTHNMGLDYIQKDSGFILDVAGYADPNYRRPEILEKWCNVVNEGFLNQNWESYYKRN